MLEPNGRVQLPASPAKATPVPVLVTFLEPAPDAAGACASIATAVPSGSVEAMLALLRSPEFLVLPMADPAEVEQRIQDLRNDWNDA